MPFLVAIETSLPKNVYSQDEIIGAFKKIWAEKFANIERLEEFHKNVLVGKRHLAMPIESYFDSSSFQKRNDAFIEVATDMANRAVDGVLKKSGLGPKDVSMLMSSTVTGLSVPSLEARVMNSMEFNPTTKRIPIFGLGCLAGAAGLNRACDYLKAYPEQAVVFFTVELCSLTVQFSDLSIPNIVSTGLFGDGCAAVLLVGDDHPKAKEAKLKWVSGESAFFPKTERVMGWDFVDTGFKVVLSKDVPMITKEKVAPALQDFLKKLNISKLDYHIAHPGGPKVLEAMEDCLNLPRGGLDLSWNSLKSFGNMSSASVLFIAKDFLDRGMDKDKNVLTIAMGPAFCAEFGVWKSL
ncbi:MAG: 3-oxoacyl-[acyl-carrier-protein] synthase III C-terminal domain-containing protein [Bdellovibrio sp.]